MKYKIVLCLTEKDALLLPMQAKILIATSSIEVLKADEDILGHKKYFYAMQKYKDLPIITVDDDSVYSKDLVQLLYDNYKKHPRCVSSMRTHRIMFANGKLLPY